MLPEFAAKQKFKYEINVDVRPKSSTSSYDAIIGSNFLQAYGIDMQFSKGKILYLGSTIPMQD